MIMYTPALRELIKLIVLEESSKKKIREADISDGKKVPWGCNEHVDDLRRRISEAEFWRDKYPRGSERRSHYRNVLNHLKSEMKSALKVNQSVLNEKDEV